MHFSCWSRDLYGCRLGICKLSADTDQVIQDWPHERVCSDVSRRREKVSSRLSWHRPLAVDGYVSVAVADHFAVMVLASGRVCIVRNSSKAATVVPGLSQVKSVCAFGCNDTALCTIEHQDAVRLVVNGDETIVERLHGVNDALALAAGRKHSLAILSVPLKPDVSSTGSLV